MNEHFQKGFIKRKDLIKTNQQGIDTSNFNFIMNLMQIYSKRNIRAKAFVKSNCQHIFIGNFTNKNNLIINFMINLIHIETVIPLRLVEYALAIKSRSLRTELYLILMLRG